MFIERGGLRIASFFVVVASTETMNREEYIVSREEYRTINILKYLY